MRVAYVTIFDGTDIRNWSGLDVHIWKSLEAQGLKIELVGNLIHGRSVRRRLRKLWGTRVQRRSFLHFWDVDTARDYAADVQDRVARIRPDVVLSPSPIPLAYLRCRQPRVLWTDATFAGLASFYPEFVPENVCSASTRCGHEIDRQSLASCDLAIYSSEWAAETARATQPNCAGKVQVVPYGANVEVSHSEQDLTEIVRRRGSQRLRLLFIGMDWQRKGGDQAVAVTGEINRLGVLAELIAVGAEPPQDVRNLTFVRALGPISKAAEAGRAQMAELLATSDFLILPSRAECCAVVLAEACAYGLPIVATEVGGMGTVVRDELNGKLFPLSSQARIWAEWIVKHARNRLAYEHLAFGAFSEYQRRLNWGVAGRRVAEELQSRFGQVGDAKEQVA